MLMLCHAVPAGAAAPRGNAMRAHLALKHHVICVLLPGKQLGDPVGQDGQEMAHRQGQQHHQQHVQIGMAGGHLGDQALRSSERGTACIASRGFGIVASACHQRNNPTRVPALAYCVMRSGVISMAQRLLEKVQAFDAAGGALALLQAPAARCLLRLPM